MRIRPRRPAVAGFRRVVVGGGARVKVFARHAAADEDPGTSKKPATLFNRFERSDANDDGVLPARIPITFVIVVDPYGEKPVAMTGSHNMKPKARGLNDENLLLIADDGDLARESAGHITQIGGQYRWRQSVQADRGKPAWEGLADDDIWPIGAPGSDAADDRRRRRELDFWFGVRGRR